MDIEKILLLQLMLILEEAVLESIFTTELSTQEKAAYGAAESDEAVGVDGV